MCLYRRSRSRMKVERIALLVYDRHGAHLYGYWSLSCARELEYDDEFMREDQPPLYCPIFLHFKVVQRIYSRVRGRYVLQYMYEVEY